jgi:hypothetical protein
MVSMTFYSEGMKAVRCIDNFLSKGIETMQRIDDSLSCPAKIFASTVVILYMLNDCVEDSDSEELYICEKKEDDKNIQQITKKVEEKKDFVSEDIEDTSLFAELFPFGLLYELSNVP